MKPDIYFQTPNFSLKGELLYSKTAYSEFGRERGWDVLQLSPSDDVLLNLKALMIEVLQPLRNVTGCAIFVNSGYRCSVLNEYIKGSKNSQHMKGQAADIRVSGEVWQTKELFELIIAGFTFDQVIYYPEQNFVHVSYCRKRKNRKQALVCQTVDGKKKYFNFEG